MKSLDDLRDAVSRCIGWRGAAKTIPLDIANSTRLDATLRVVAEILNRLEDIDRRLERLEKKVGGW